MKETRTGSEVKSVRGMEIEEIDPNDIGIVYVLLPKKISERELLFLFLLSKKLETGVY